MINAGAHELHGIYLTVPGLLTVASNGEAAGLIAPRPQFIGIGETDPLTPRGAVDFELVQTVAADRTVGAEDWLSRRREPASRYVEMPDMRAALLYFFEGWLSG